MPICILSFKELSSCTPLTVNTDADLEKEPLTSKLEQERAKDREEERNRALKREGAKRDVNGCLSRESSAILCSLSAAAIEREEI